MAVRLPEADGASLGVLARLPALPGSQWCPSASLLLNWEVRLMDPSV